MKQKPQQKYKQLLINFYNFRPCDFIQRGDKIFCCSKDNVDFNVRDIYECLKEEENENRNFL